MNIKKLSFGLTNIVSPYVSIDWLINRTGKSIIFPFYHLVTKDEIVPEHIKHLYKPKTIKQFEKDLDFFLLHYKALHWKELGNEHAKKGFYLSFDDGLQEFYTVVAPILLRKGVPAAFFVNSDFVDNKDLFFRYKASIIIEKLVKYPALERKLATQKWLKSNSKTNLSSTIKSVTYEQRYKLDELALILEVDFEAYLSVQKPYMNEAQIEALISQGFTVGAHSVDHPLYSSITLKEQISQTDLSLKYLQTRFGADKHYMSFPFTDDGVSKGYFDATQNLYPDLKSFGTAGIKVDCIPNHYQRIPMEEYNADAETVIKHEYIYFLLKAIVGRNTIIRS